MPALPFCRARLTAQKRRADYPKQLNTLGDHLHRRRLDLGLSWKAVSELIGVDADTLTNWTRGRTQPGLRCLPLVIWFLGYDPLPAAKSVGEALVRYRELRGMSQTQLAAKLQVDPGTLARWEREKRSPTGDYLRRVKRQLST
jgi:transcriptional regulator with XRE-family HTH domain